MFYRYDTWVSEPLGPAVAGASVAVLTDPSDFSTQPGSPLADIYAASESNSANITAATWAAQQIIFTLDAVPDDVVEGSYIGVSGAGPDGYNSSLSAPWLVLGVNGLEVTVQSFTNPGTYVSGGTVATSLLPNPTSTDGNGHAFFYADSGLYGVQIYGPIDEQDYPDQGVGFAAGGSVTSVGLSMPAEFDVSGSPVTTSGTIGSTWNTETANYVFAGPTSGGDDVPAFRALVAADIPSLAYASSVGLTVSVPAILTQSVSGSPVTTTGTLAVTLGLATETENTVWAGPSSGSAAQPTFRALVTADIPLVTMPVDTLSGSTDVVVFGTDNFVTTAGVDAMTLATPTAVTDDGKTVRVTDVSGNAHTVTTSSNKIVPSHALVTFNGTAGSWIELEAYGGLWYPRANSGVVIS